MHVWNYLESNISVFHTARYPQVSATESLFTFFLFVFSVALLNSWNSSTLTAICLCQLFFFLFTRHYTFREVQIILSFSFIHDVFNHLTVWKCQSITKRQIYSFFFLFFFSMLLYSFPFPILPFLLPFMHIIVKIVKLDSCPGHWSFVKTVSLSNVFITFTHERAICVVEILPASRHCPKNSKTHAARAKAVISRVMWGFLCYLTFFNECWLV